MSASRERAGYWFPAKRYGWGWGLPSRWQGWAVLAGYGVAMTGAGLAGESLDAPVGPALAWSLIVVSTAAFVIICWRTGEPPRRRWRS